MLKAVFIFEVFFILEVVLIFELVFIFEVVFLSTSSDNLKRPIVPLKVEAASLEINCGLYWYGL